MDDETPIGARIRYWRERRDMRQHVVAGLVGRSSSWLSKVERGEIPMDSVAVLFALARVLKVEPRDLLPKLELDANGGAPLDPPRGIHAVRGAVLLPPPGDLEPPTADQLRADVERIHRPSMRGTVDARALLIPDLLRRGRVAAAHEVPGSWWCLAEFYRIASELARRVGEVELAWITADRAVAAAQQSGDPLMVARARRQLAFALMSEGWLDAAGAVCSDGADALAPTDVRSPEVWSLWGSLQLTEAVVAVRGQDPADAWRLLRDARAAGERVGAGRNDYWECFGPANVGAHEVAVALDIGDPVEALRLADRVDIEEFPSEERRSTFMIDVAHAYGLREDDAAAVGLLVEADRQSADAVRYSVKARELITVCLGREQKHRTPGLRGLADKHRVPR